MPSVKMFLAFAVLALTYTGSLAQTVAGTCDQDDGKYFTDTKSQTYKIKGTLAAPGTHHAYREVAGTPPSPSGSSSPPPPSGSSGSTPPAETSAPATSPPPSSPPPFTPPPAQESLEIVSNPKCGTDAGKGWVADDGENDFQNGCLSIQYMNNPPAPGYTANECILSDGEGPGTTTCEHWFAYTVPPPAQPETDPFPYTLCETVCPFSDGMIYESDHGERFKMSCSKRHGMKVLWTQPAETFDDCMDMCAKIVPCHSVDYQARTKKCYLGGNNGQPSIAAASFASATSIGSGVDKKDEWNGDGSLTGRA
ncbi:uncharacterized protein GIQ15_06836 [Arthroderma uncinatum]|uniref:uncharacterized protein n=1 Tax=Arthroderma uncinatum TaxID=74035 RepID=UPI00144AF6AD|nr:uncharacterized protein GIQ15_06836 [Arthroderma uncinatum]KAF3479860.1 hypothetical protein GIQ15_06836 [Arthroderma uncinatum]